MWAAVKRLEDVGLLILWNTYAQIMHLDNANITLLPDDNPDRAVFWRISDSVVEQVDHGLAQPVAIRL